MDQQTSPKTGLSPLKQALIAIEDLQQKLARAERANNEPVAIVGMACRLPGHVENPQAFWDFLQRGDDGVVRNPDQRWPVAELVAADPAAADKTVTLAAGLIDDYDKMDAGFFGLSPREVETMDPQQRLALELAWSTLQDAGYPATRMEGSNTGVFLGVGATEYFRLCLESGNQDRGFFITGNTQNVIGGRIAYLLGLHGPCVAIDTACSSSLVAVHTAVQALRRGECDAALAGGVNMLVDPEVFVSLSKAGMLSPDGACKTFDAGANGYVRGEGGGMLLLKTLARAQADGDRIHALIRGSAVNQDGRSSSLTAPNGPAQQAVMRKALNNASLKPGEVDYVETHGTGTPLGDPIEVGALQAVYGQGRQQPLILGALKSSIGHLEAASGVASIIKAVLVLQHRQVPKNLHFQKLNPMLDIAPESIALASETMALGVAGKAAVAAVSSFGFSGTNAHILLQQADTAAQQAATEAATEATTEAAIALRPQLCMLSAKSEAALQTLAQRLQDYLQAAQKPTLEQLCANLNGGRDHYRFRQALVVQDHDDLATQLQALANDASGAARISNETLANGPRIGFMFTGQGSQYAGMARQLYQSQPAFRAALDECASLLAAQLDQPLLAILWGEASSQINETCYTQPALFCVEYALAQLWQSWGIKPTVVMGHSVGEYVAAVVAGMMTLADGLTLIAARGKLMHSLPAGGGMLVALTDPGTVQQALAAQGNAQLAIAGMNAPQQTVLAGDLGALAQMKQQLQEQGVRCIDLAVSHAFHSPLMNSIVAPFQQQATQINFSAPQITIISNVTGLEGDDSMRSAAYWARHIVAPVNFAQGVQAFAGHADLVLELGPKSTLIGLARQCLPVSPVQWVPGLRAADKDNLALANALAEVYRHGARIDWRGVHGDWQKLSLPLYPYQRQRHWVQGSGSKRVVQAALPGITGGRVNPLIGQRQPLPGLAATCYQTSLSVNSPPYLEHHRLFGMVIVPGASHVAMVLTAVRERFGSAACELYDVVFYQPVAIADEGSKLLQLWLTPKSGNEHEFKIMSLRDPDYPHQESAWTVHATGVVSMEQAAAMAAPLDPAQTSTEWPLQETGHDFYQRIWDGGYTLGSAFRWVGDRWSLGEQTLHRMVLPELPDGALDYQIHPGLLDSCFQAFGSSAGLTVAQDDIYIPFGVARMKFWRQPPGQGLWCYSRVRNESGPGASQRFIGDLTLIDDHGELVFHIEGLELRKSSQKLLKQGLQDSLGGSNLNVYQQGWVPAPGNPPRLAETSAPWLVLWPARPEPRMQSLLRQHGHVLINVQPGAGFLRLEGDLYQVRRGQVQDYADLLETLAERPLAGILDLRASTLGFDAAASPAALQQQLLTASGDLIALVQALAQQMAGQKMRWLVATSAAHGWQLQQAKSINPCQNALWAMGRVMAVEQPHIESVWLDLDQDGSDFNMAAADLLAQEMLVQSDERQRLLRTEGRYMARLARSPQPAEIKPLDPAMLAEQTCLLGGALGGLGLALASWLVRHGARHLALLVRRTPAANEQRQIDALVAQGARVELLQADITDAQQLEAAMQHMQRSMPALGAVFHLAGVVADQALDQADAATMEKVFSPKVAGGWNLHRATLALQPQHFVMFSSMASMFGTPGQGSYAIANAFLDALVQYRQSLGLPALSINWGPWAEVGMAARQTNGDNRMEAAGLRAFEPDSGMDLMAQLMGGSQVNAGAIRIDWPLFLQRFPGASGNTTLQVFREQFGADKGARGGMLAALEAVPTGERRALLTTQVVDILVEILRLPQGDPVSLDLGFFDAGMDSLMSLEFRQRLGHEYDITLPPTVAFNYPTVGELIGYLSQDMLPLAFEDKAQESSGQTTSSPDLQQEDEAMQLAAVEDLSEDELAALLAEQLGQ